MRVFSFAINLARFLWANVKSVCRAAKSVMWMLLPFYGLTLLLGFIQGFILAPWYTATLEQYGRFLVNNLMEVKIMEYFDEPFDSWGNVAPVFHIPQIKNPLKWTAQFGLVRPGDSGSENVEALATLSDLYRRTRRYSRAPQWHHWIYLSAQQEPWRQPDGPVLHDPWDKAFVELLEYRDKHDTMGRSNFLYVSCPKNFLCGSWRVTAPALLHFTTEGEKSRASKRSPELPNHASVNVRVFELPLRETAIPGVFPSHFEQMRSLTASNSTFWGTKDTYSHFDQVLGQAVPMLREVEKAYPWTYGLLVKAEDKWTHLWAMEDTALLMIVRILSIASSAVPTYLFKFASLRWSDSPGPGPEHKSKDPLAQTLQSLVDILSEEDEEKFRKTDRGRRILALAEAGLERDEWNTREEVLKEISDAMGLDEHGQIEDL
jgi:hypothetical protein